MRWLARCLSLLVATCAPAVADPPNIQTQITVFSDFRPIPPPPFIQPDQIPTQITAILTGWDSDNFAIATVAPIKNPAGCPGPQFYQADSSQPGYHTYYAAALLAFAERATVIVVVAGQGCATGRPKLIGLHIVR